MKLKNGNAVSVSELTNESYIKILDAFRNSGASVDADFYVRGLEYARQLKFIEFYKSRLVRTDKCEYENMLLSVDEILGVDNKVGNDWHEKGELPPVGVECNYFWNSRPETWEKAVIVASGFDFDIPCVVVKVRDQIRITSTPQDFRPIKSEREKAIEEIKGIIMRPFVENPEDKAASIYDAGYRKVN